MSLRRLIERELIAGVRGRRRRALVERLRGNAHERRGWDRAIAAFRELEQREVSRFELDQVERWLFDDLGDLGAVVEPTRASRRWTWLAGTLAALATIGALLLWIDVGGGESESVVDGAPAGDAGGLQARGVHGWARPLALEPVCGSPARPASARGCAQDELLGFSTRLGAEALAPAAASALAEAPLHLSVFGLRADGELLYYLPTPNDAALASAALGAAWQALPLSVRLDVNHEPGRVRVFALASDSPPSVADIERWAAALEPQPLAELDDPPWHLRLSPQLLGPVCRRSSRCASAETELTIVPRTTKP